MRVVVGLGFIGQAVSKRLPDAIPIRCSSKDRNLDRNGEWLHLEGVETLYLCAGRTGGVGRMSSDPMSFVYPNVRIHMNVFEACVKAGVKRVVCVGSTTGYPNTSEAVTEDQYLEGKLHPAYEIPGSAHRFIKRLASWQPFETVFFRPSNVYGPGNNFDPKLSHVIEASVRKVFEKQDPFVIWGSGAETRDAIYIEDLAEAISYGETCPPGDYNVGSGEEMSVNEIVITLNAHARHYPEIVYDRTKPTAIPARRVDCTKLKALGWTPKVSMKKGLERTYDWFQTQSSKD